MSALRSLVAISLGLVLPMWVSAADPWGVAGSESLCPFVKEWRVVLAADGAQGMEPEIQGWRLEDRPVTQNELDDVEAMLLPKLAADLKAVGTPALPCEYYRQYASGRSNQYHLL